MRILALEPFFGGSHQAFLDGWQRHSRHKWTVLGLPGCHWKWRMRHAALHFAEQATEQWNEGARWDVIWCSDMLDLAQFRGLTTRSLSDTPAIAYFHENQLTYPNRLPQERDLHFAFTNFTTAVTANQVWFNSDYHCNEFLNAMNNWFRKMPDFAPNQALAGVRDKSITQSPGIDRTIIRPDRIPGPLRIAWAARWEHDKNPSDFFDAVDHLDRMGCQFRLMVFGQSFAETPTVFQQASKRYRERIDHWGFVDAHSDYLDLLKQADVIVSTAIHEFFGLAIMESIAAGLFPILPRRLSYPELLQLESSATAESFFYDGRSTQLAERLAELANDIGRLSNSSRHEWLKKCCERYLWPNRAAAMDDALETLVHAPGWSPDQPT